MQTRSLGKTGPAVAAIGLGCTPPVVRGLKFEMVPGSLLSSFGLAPRSPFRLVGEQIDGSVELGAANYLVEAKWQAAKLGQEHAAR